MKQRRWILAAMTVCLSFALGVAHSWWPPGPVAADRTAGVAPVRVSDGPVGTPPASHPAAAVPGRDDTMAPPAGPAKTSAAPPTRTAAPAGDPSGDAVRAWVRDAVKARRQRDWARLRALGERLNTASRRDVNILLHLLQRESDSESMLVIGELVTDTARVPGRELDRGTVGPALCRAARKVLDRVDAAGEQRARAVALLAVWSAADDVPTLLALLSGRDVPPELGSAAAVALAQSADPRIWLESLRREADAAADVRALARIAVALDGVGRRSDDPSTTAWLSGTLVPRLQQRLGAAVVADPAPESVGEVIGALAMISHDSQVNAALAAIAVQPDAATRRRLVAWLPEAVSPEEWVDARAVLMRDPELREAVAGVDARMRARSRDGE